MDVRTLAGIVCFWSMAAMAAEALAAEKTEAAKIDPTPFGLVLGKTTREEALEILRKEGGSVTESGKRIIKDDIVNPRVEGYFLDGVGIEGVVTTKAWFLDGVLMQLTYGLSGSFQPFHDQLKARYGAATKTRTSFGGEAHALWSFKDVELSLDRPFMGGMSMTYTHRRLYQESKAVDAKVYAEATKAMGRKQKGF